MLRPLIILLLICFPIISFGQTGIITTYAGYSDSAGYSGDGGPANKCKFNAPCELAFDPSGNLIISDAQNHVIRKINSAGIITTIVGTGIAGYNGDGIPATAAQLNCPIGIAYDDTGNLYIAEYAGSRIRKVNTSGIISTIGGNGLSGFNGDTGIAINAKLKDPYGLTVDKKGNVYFSDVLNYRIRKIDKAGKISTFAGSGVWGYSGDGGPATKAKFGQISCLAIGPSGTMYVADWDNARTRKIDTSGIVTTFAGNGTSGYSGDGGLAINAELIAPNGVNVDDSENVYIPDNFARVVRKVDRSGIITTIAGSGKKGYSGDGGLATDAEMYEPQDAIRDKSGNLFISDVSNNNIRKVTFYKTAVNNIIPIQSYFSIYPNPASQNINIKVTEKIETIEITNTLGQLVFHHSYNKQSQVQIDVNSFANGLYFVKLNGVDVEKFLKE